MQPTDRDTVSTSSSPVYHEILSSHSTKRGVSITSKRQVRRKLFDKPSQDDVEGPENHMGHAGGSLVTRDDVEGPENHMGHAGGSLVTRDDVEGPENHMRYAGGSLVTRDDVKGPENCMEDAGGSPETRDDTGGPVNRVEDAEGQRETQYSAGGHATIRGGRRVNRRPILQWNRIFPGGAYTPRRINFTEVEQILKPLPPNPIAQNFFKLYIGEGIVDHIVTQTNLYAETYIERERQNFRPHSLVKEWRPTDREEMLTFLAMLVLMKIIHKPRISMYWTKDGMVSTSVFSQLMRRDRLLLIMRFLHFADNRNHNPADPDRNKLYKIREVSDMIRRRCSEAFYPGKNSRVDESLVLFKGRLSFKQYIKSKRARFGIKLYKLCTTDGIVLDYVIYHGGMAQELTEVQYALITEKIPVTLMQKYLGKGHHLYVDNYYTSIALQNIYYRMRHMSLGP